MVEFPRRVEIVDSGGRPAFRMTITPMAFAFAIRRKRKQEFGLIAKKPIGAGNGKRMKAKLPKMTPEFKAILEKVSKACLAIGRRTPHGCGRYHCCIEFEIDKGAESDFIIKRKSHARLLK